MYVITCVVCKCVCVCVCMCVGVCVCVPTRAYKCVWDVCMCVSTRQPSHQLQGAVHSQSLPTRFQPHLFSFFCFFHLIKTNALHIIIFVCAQFLSNIHNNDKVDNTELQQHKTGVHYNVTIISYKAFAMSGL